MKRSRRRFVGRLAGCAVVLPLATLTQSVQAADMPKLDPDEMAAKSLNYTDAATDIAKRCSGCQFYTDPSAAECGPCVIFPQHTVSANGSCNSWLQRAG